MATDLRARAITSTGAICWCWKANVHLIYALVRADKVNRTGRLFVIVGRETFSAAMRLSSELERQTKAIFVGEPTGSSLNAIGEMNPVTLPYSKMSGSIASRGGGNSADTRTWIAPQFLSAGPRKTGHFSPENTRKPLILKCRLGQPIFIFSLSAAGGCPTTLPGIGHLY